MTTLKIYPERKQRNGTVAGGKKNVIKGKFLCVFLLKQEIIESFNCRGKCSHTETRIDNTRGKRADRRSLKEILRNLDETLSWEQECIIHCSSSKLRVWQDHQLRLCMCEVWEYRGARSSEMSNGQQFEESGQLVKLFFFLNTEANILVKCRNISGWQCLWHLRFAAMHLKWDQSAQL